MIRLKMLEKITCILTPVTFDCADCWPVSVEGSAAVLACAVQKRHSYSR